VAKNKSQIGYSCTSTGKVTLTSVHVSDFHTRLKTKLSKVHAIIFYQVTFTQKYTTFISSCRAQQRFCHL